MGIYKVCLQMTQKKYDLKLKGYVGGADFDHKAVDNILQQCADQEVNVLIDSTGGSLATGLSISAAFKLHGKVAVHFVGLNASAATIASLGAAHISMDAGAMYLVHQCSAAFFEWGALNADQFAALIADCEKIKADLDKLDLNCAQLYARRCKRNTEDLLELMKAGGWLSAKEALEWGFIDEITDLDDENAPELTDAIASAMASAGIPLPNIPVAKVEKDSAFFKFISAITSFFKQDSISKKSISLSMKSFKFISAILADNPFSLSEEKAYLSKEQLVAIENHIKSLEEKISDSSKAIADKDSEIADLKAKLDKKPAADSTQVVDESKSSKQPANAVDQYIKSYNSAKALFDLV